VAAYPAWAFVELVGRSVLLWVWPWPLRLDHPLRFVDQFDPLSAVTFAVLGIGLVVALILYRKRAPLAVWGAIWILAGFLPLAPLFWLTTRGLFQENRMAFSAVGLAWLTTAAARAVWTRVDARARTSGIARGAALVVCAALGIALIGVDRWRSETWRDDRRLWGEVLRHAPENLTAHVNLGIAYIDTGELDRGEAVLRAGLRLDPAYARLHYNLAVVSFRRERHEDARASLLRAISSNPAYVEAYRMLAIVDLKQGNLGEAQSALQQSIALNPRDAKAHERLGLLAQQAGDDAAAEGAYLEALRYDPDSALARNNLGTIYLKRRDWSRALEQFTIAVRRDPTDVDVALNRAVALSALGRKDDARAAAETLLRNLPPDARFDAHRRAAETILGEGRS
jgi:tetratricopeptide (TPR) repeat protein